VIAHVKRAERLGFLERAVGVKRSLRLTPAGLDDLGASGLRDDAGEVSWAGNPSCTSGEIQTAP
jgi:hypothetical protein